MDDFAAIDFETANRYPGSVCSVGIVIVRNRLVTDKIYRLIRPRPNFYSRINTQIHGMTCLDTNEADEFPEVWEEIDPFVRDYPLVAHNSPFDEGCLKAVFQLYDLAYPKYEFHCTVRASRKKFPYLFNRKLNTVAEHVGFLLENHHNALADAEACAAIALRVF